MSADPVTPNPHTGAMFNRYNYAANNPYRFTDPDGRAPEGIGRAIDYDIRAMARGEISQEEFAQRQEARGAGGVVGVAVVATVVTGGRALPLLKAVLKPVGRRMAEEAKNDRKQRNAPPGPDANAEGRPHSRIERPGADGQYTTHNGDGTYKQYRGSGQDHGGIERPNVKETKLNTAPDGKQYPGKPEVRPARPDEIPRGP